MTQPVVARLNELVNARIPLARAAGIQISLDPCGQIQAHAPLAGNDNPHGSAFGGSLYITALVAGYGQTWLMLDTAGIDATVVVRHAEVDYSRPLHSDIVARVKPVSAHARARFLGATKRRGRGRVALTVTIADDKIRVFDLHARFAAIAARNNGETAADLS